MKRLIGCSLAFVLVFLCTFNVHAQDLQEIVDCKVDADYVKAKYIGEEYIKTGLSDKEFVKRNDVVESISCTEIIGKEKDELLTVNSSDGTYTNEDFDLTLTDIKLTDDSTVRILKGKSKTHSGTNEKDGMKLTASMTWYDRSGTNNTLTSVTGYRSASTPGMLHYSYGHKFTEWGHGDVESTFSETGLGKDAYNFWLSLSSPTKEGNTVTLNIASSLFD